MGTISRRGFVTGLGAGLVIIKSSRAATDDAALDAIIGRLIMINLRAESPGPLFLEQLARYAVGGVYLDRPVFSSADNARAVTAALGRAATAPLVLATDCEGGPVNRCSRIRKFDSGRNLERARESGGMTDSAFRRYYEGKGRFLKSLGLNHNFDPVLDLAIPGSPIGERAFGRDPAAVSAAARLAVAGYLAAGVGCTAKHFPGLGAVTVDTHRAMATIDTPISELRDSALAPFAAAVEAGIPAVMLAHLRLTALDPERPASLSPVVIHSLLRGELGFRGVIVPDSLTMDAITRYLGGVNRQEPWLLAKRCVAAFKAGCDLIFNFHTPPSHTAIIVAAVREAVKSGELSADRLAASAARVASLAASGSVPPEIPAAETQPAEPVTGQTASEPVPVEPPVEPTPGDTGAPPTAEETPEAFTLDDW